MKKFLSIAVALAMVLSLSVVAFADTTVATQDLTASGTLTLLEGVDFTDETLYLAIYFEVTDSSKIGYGPMALCDSDWVSYTGYGTAYDIHQVNEDGVITVPLTTIAEAFEASGVDPADGIVLNWWADSQDYANLTGVALMSTSDEVAATEDTFADEEADTTEATEETTEAAEETTTTSPSTGVALALLPMAIAGIAVVSSKRR
ncbi:MAG: hypothetical protein LUE20_02915 [Oscillospiraceae bacterium]|nr:hypothetical protein [Oscillospiraceae bacterium]